MEGGGGGRGDVVGDEGGIKWKFLMSGTILTNQRPFLILVPTL